MFICKVYFKLFKDIFEIMQTSNMKTLIFKEGLSYTVNIEEILNKE